MAKIIKPDKANGLDDLTHLKEKKVYHISIVVPVYNEEDNVKNLYEEIRQACEENNYTYEIIFINDGSSDKTDAICRTLAPPIKIYMPASQFWSNCRYGRRHQSR